MWKNKDFDDILEVIISRQLGLSISMVENYLFTRSHQQGRETLNAIKSDYSLLMDYWKKGYDDPQRIALYEKLLHRMYALVADMLFQSVLQSHYSLSLLYRQAHEGRYDFSPAVITETLEAFVSETAILELEQEHVRQQKMETIYQQHQQYMQILFAFFCCSPQWKEAEGMAFEEMLLSPTIDVMDQQLIVSAISLALMNVFDITKFRVLVDIYEKATDETLRQRALVGWVMAANDRLAPLYPEMKTTLCRLCEQDVCRKELVELQLQMVYCMAADDDSRRIRNEIMPDIMKGSNIKMTRQGLVEMEDDQLENILHPEAAEKNIEQMEASMKMMADMQRRGSDIYFAGFSQMKRFSFFNDISNWFMPFTPHHPGISRIWEQSKGRRFLQLMTRIGAFCDSDKYSFVLAYSQVMAQMPPQMLKMVEDGEATPMAIGGEVPFEEQLKPAYIRRGYLQNLYRFFRLFPQRSEFCTPFVYPQAVFCCRQLFMGSDLEDNMIEVAAFLAKNKLPSEAVTMLERMRRKNKEGEFFLLLGQLKMSLAKDGELPPDIPHLFNMAKTLLAQSDNTKAYERALKSYARAIFQEGNYIEALQTYGHLLEIHPDNRNHLLNAAICKVKLARYEEALKDLYKLNYENENDPFVNSTMAWTLTLTGKYDQAQRYYDQLLSQKQKNPTDVLNGGFNRWFKKDIPAAVSLFRQYVDMQVEGRDLLIADFKKTEHAVLQERGISDVEIQLMLDAVFL